jgi:LEA14-like dessication related protein
MRIQKMNFLRLTGCVTVVFLWSIAAVAQVNMVEFGKNRVQYTKFKWSFYQSPNFNVHYNQNGLELAKFATQTAEEELPSLEDFIEFGIQRRLNIVLYNNYNDYKQSNIGLGLDWPNIGGVTKLVNNKLVVYYNGDHNDLRRQIREGIARVLVETLLFGDDLGEFAQNQALLDLPKWMTDGYISYAAENWSTKLDNELKSAMLGFTYKNFYHFAFEQPKLAGHAFWYYIEERYKRENVTYLLYLSRIYKNVNRATQTVCKKKLKDVLAEFMQYSRDKYFKDIRARRNVPSGRLTLPKEIGKKDFFRFQANPNPKSFNYAVVEYKKGLTRVVLNENFISEKRLWKSGIRNLEEKPNPNYPLLAWDPKGTRIAMIVWEKGKVLLSVYDAFRRIKTIKNQVLPFEQINDMQYMLDPNTLILSGVKGGQSDIFVYKINEQKLEQITNDVYDDLDASFVAFPGKTGIIFSSNRPSPDALTGDTVLPKNRYNVFLVDNWNKSEFRQISQLTNIKYGNARFPSQYNTNHFTFISDENGIGNRWAGFFRTQAAGVDTLYRIGEDILRNPDYKELDSTLKAWNKSEPDSIGFFRVTNDSTYTFPLSNYQSSVLETRIAGDNGQVTEVNRQGEFKFLYKLKVDENTLRKRNVNARPTEFIKRTSRLEKIAGEDTQIRSDLEDSTQTQIKSNDFFETEFKNDSSKTGEKLMGSVKPKSDEILNRMRLFPYRKKFFVDNLTTNFLSNNTIIINRLQPYTGASGPVNLANGSPLNAMTRVGAMEFMEDYKFTGGFRINYGFEDKEVFMRYDNLRRRLDWGLTYYRSTTTVGFSDGVNSFAGRQLVNIYQGNITWPFNEVQSFRLIAGIRRDLYTIKSDESNINSLLQPDLDENFLTARAEFVHDNTISPVSNIWHGLRYKGWFELYNRLSGSYQAQDRTRGGDITFNVGFDARNYVKIYRNFIWAVRGAVDLSWGDNKFIYYLGGTDGWLMLGPNDVVRNGVPKQRYFNTSNRPAQDVSYVYESLAVNLRGFTQNAANGNNAVVINSELRLPLFATLFNKPINNAFLRNFQLVQFIDLGTAWNGRFNKIGRPEVVYSEPGNPLSVVSTAPGIGPFLGSYGFGARSTLLGYFVRFDAGWPMSGFFNSKPILHVSLGFDF